MTGKVFQSSLEFNKDFFKTLDFRKEKKAVLLCPPEYFKVIDIKNAHMEGQLGNIDIKKSKNQWKEMKNAFEEKGIDVHLLNAQKGLEDMVFTANPSFVGEDEFGQKIAVLSNMRHDSRKKEVKSFKNWFENQGYEIKKVNLNFLFEGHGDGIWHPKYRLIWGGYGYRTTVGVYQELSDIFSCPIIPLRLENPHFYHLDTCFCPLDEKTVLYYPGAFDSEGLAWIEKVFVNCIEVNEDEAKNGFACNAWAWGEYVFIHKGNYICNKEMTKRGFKVIELDTSEFMKSGGSVFCMKVEIF